MGRGGGGHRLPTDSIRNYARMYVYMDRGGLHDPVLAERGIEQSDAASRVDRDGPSASFLCGGDDGIVLECRVEGSQLTMDPYRSPDDCHGTVYRSSKDERLGALETLSDSLEIPL